MDLNPDLSCSKHFALLSKCEWIHNFQVTDVFKEDVISKKLPENWYSCLAKLSVEELNEVPFLEGKSRSEYPEWPTSLHDFLSESSQLSGFKNKVLEDSEIKPIYISANMARGMNSKKLHEVTRMAALVYETAIETECDIVVDIGSGLGYLDHVLHQKYGLKILGMETVQSHASAAERRAVKQGITCDGIKSLQCHIEDNEDSYAAFVSTIKTVYPTLHCDCNKKLADKTQHTEASCEAGKSSPKICLIGLHCCGDLSTTMISYFSACEYIRAICCVCCCYHKMTYSNEKFSKFPLSEKGTMVCRQFTQKLGKSFITPFTLRLGAQETRCRWRQQTKTDHESHINHVAFRGLLSFTDEEDGHIRQKVRHSKFNSIHDFIDSFYGSSAENPSIVEKRSQLLSLYDQYKKDFDAIEILTLLQVILQPVIETLLYQDREQWLKEQGHRNVKIVPVFDEMISPRNLCLVATKIKI